MIKKIKQNTLFLHWRLVPKSIWFIGLATFLMNASTIIILSYSPLYLTSVMGVSMIVFGRIEGFVEMLSWVVRVIAGILSDFFGKRKIFILVSSLLAALARPIFPLATSVSAIVLGRSLDRIANGFQASPREALIADLAPKALKGMCFGIRQALGTAGSAVGALLGVCIMFMTDGNYKIVFWVATIPPIFSILFLMFMVKEPSQTARTRKITNYSLAVFMQALIRRVGEIRHFSKAYWVLILITMLFLMGRFGAGFLINFSADIGLGEKYAPMVMIAFNVVSSIAAYFLGSASDKWGRGAILSAGFALMLAADIILACADSIAMAVLGMMLWGAQFGITQSVPMAMIADLAPKNLRGTAFGIFYIMCGVALFFANTFAGWIIGTYGQFYVFFTTGSFALFALIGMLYYSGAKEPKTQK